MSCLSCNLCTCTITTQTKTELIIYPISTLASKLQHHHYKIKTNRKVSDKHEKYGKFDKDDKDDKDDKCDRISQNEGYDARDTVDTVISKIVSVPSQQFGSKGPDIYIKDEHSQAHAKQGPDSLNLVVDSQNKQNMSQNIQYTVSSPHPISHTQLSLKLPQSLAQSHLTCLKSPQSHKPLQLSNILSPQSSSITQKNLQAILLQKQNDQLKEQYSRLKQIEKQLLCQQQRMKQKNNRELGHLKKRSDELESRSVKRGKQLQELKNMLGIVRARRQSVGFDPTTVKQK